RGPHLRSDDGPNLRVGRCDDNRARCSRRGDQQGRDRAAEGHERRVRGTTMKGIVSGRARLAAVVDSSGSEVDVLLHGDASSWRRMHIRELLGLLGDIDDLRSIADVTRERLAIELERAVRTEQSLWLWLILLDRHRSVRIREE